MDLLISYNLSFSSELFLQNFIFLLGIAFVSSVGKSALKPKAQRSKALVLFATKVRRT